MARALKIDVMFCFRMKTLHHTFIAKCIIQWLSIWKHQSLCFFLQKKIVIVMLWLDDGKQYGFVVHSDWKHCADGTVKDHYSVMYLSVSYTDALMSLLLLIMDAHFFLLFFIILSCFLFCSSVTGLYYFFYVFILFQLLLMIKEIPIFQNSKFHEIELVNVLTQCAASQCYNKVAKLRNIWWFLLSISSTCALLTSSWTGNLFSQWIFWHLPPVFLCLHAAMPWPKLWVFLLAACQSLAQWTY